MTLQEQITESCKDVQTELLQYSTVWNGKRVIIRPIKYLNTIEVYIAKQEALVYSLTEDSNKIAKDIYQNVHNFSNKN